MGLAAMRSQGVENHIHMVALCTFWYNFIRVQKTLKTAFGMVLARRRYASSMDDLREMAEDPAALKSGQVSVQEGFEN
ncbi:hypothetical protein C7I84_02165 [Mesorhizobium ephedrae]|uniref:Uncharacterized protein n=1 Tax=Kumtagia ephedrae TaxID=2116701 RepID=A0A2P7SRR2_9HYPH|nr:hypothetical protein C7I84_02165 [Mesorhizobium ephedrae]